MGTSKNKKKTPAGDDYLKASRKGSREAELALYGRPLPKNKVHKSKKVYDRKRSNKGAPRVPFDFYGGKESTPTIITSTVKGVDAGVCNVCVNGPIIIIFAVWSISPAVK